MRPHPRLRKTMKWGGAAVGVLMLAAWAASERWYLHHYAWPWLYGAQRGGAYLVHDRGAMYRMPPGVYTGRVDPTVPKVWWANASISGGRTYVGIPFWLPAVVAGLCGAIAWRLDVIARRRARAGACPRCLYSRAGLAANAPCPECGAAPITIAAEATL
ncbi:MAG: hypothetical protein IPK69_06415 [Phycisphaerales bacterium]|nr:MAG: hypothetical protein IPK69_06415 [Phycisphaerales bacterium]